MARQPHILLVVLDAARRDAFSPYGGPAGATPAIAGLAHRGVAARHAYAAAPWTLPSHTAMFTGRLAVELGLDQAPGEDPRSVQPVLAAIEDQLLASTLSAAGYRTHGYSSNLWVSQHSGFDTGFGDFLYAPSHRGDRAGGLVSESRLAARLSWVAEGLRSRGDDGAATVGAELRRAIRDCDTDTPQFFFVNLVEAHSPYLPPLPFDDLGPLNRIRAALECERYLNFTAICLAAAGALAPPPATLARLQHLHERAVSYCDAWLAGVLATLAARAMLDDTLVLVVSDHGESFGEDGLLAHGFSVGQQLIHVPLIAAGPGAERFDRGDRVLSFVDLPALISDVAGLSGHGYAQRDDGIAVAHYGAICTPDDPRATRFQANYSLSDEQIVRFAAGERAATDGTLKLTVSDTGRRSLVDLSTGARLDPAGPESSALWAALDGVTRDETAAPAPQAAPAPVEPDEVDALERQMRLLGYL